ncbi:uncharacterized protein LOC125670073 isoform X1 [Ostrea edulis]|uniref:uncharacterized protein LOC125670073 isoform X1 n=1 Tax=Ostrea edulis TaxID=37623 RepID=UPI0024AFE2E0|nr:uncharacterized protein LOC125670073 isoform X1 [Ostrea edulis]
MGIPSLMILCASLVSFSLTQNSDVPRRCVIIQDKQKLSLPRVVPSFLTTEDKGTCRTPGALFTDRQALRCGNTDVFIKPECVCSFYNVHEAKYHSHTACPRGQTSDDVTKLRCPDCKRYSFDNKGPCTNGGNLTCKGDEVAPMITCDCPSGFSGMFCENEMIKVTRICDRTESSSHPNLNNCDITKKECLTYSENKRYVFKCNETSTKEEKPGSLPLCREVEIILRRVTTTTEANNPSDQNSASTRFTSRAETVTSCPILSILTGLVLKSLL